MPTCITSCPMSAAFCATAFRLLDAIRAMFPGGTITGCPKVRCMEIIAELEGAGRGAYTGAVGYLNRDGSCDLNILIRTITARSNALKFRAGAGIVADSNPMQELAETRAKAEGLLRALKAGILNTWINGRSRTLIDHRDRGLQYGDGVFETMRVRRRRVRLLDFHLDRLFEGCRRLKIEPPSAGRLRRELESRAAHARRRGAQADRDPRTRIARLSTERRGALHTGNFAACAAAPRRRSGAPGGAGAHVRHTARYQPDSGGPQDAQSPRIGDGAQRMA